MATDTAREQLRQQSVANIFNAANIQSEITRREASGELDKEHAAALRRLAVFDTQRAQAELDYRQAETQRAQAATQTENAMRGLKQEEARSTIRAQGAAAAAQTAAAERQRVETQQAQELFPARKQLAEAQSKLYTVPGVNGGPDVQIPGSEMPHYLAGIAQRDATARQHYIANVREAQAAEQSAQRNELSRMEAVSKMEEQIVGTKSRFKEAAIPFMDTFNKNFTGNYVWISFPDIPRGIIGFRTIESKYDNENTRVEIPPDRNGLRPTAAQIYELATNPNRPGGPMTVKEYLEKIYYPEKVGRPAPWVPQQ